MQMKFKTLQQRTAILILLPTLVLLIGMGWGGFIFAKKSLLTLWSETATAQLQKAAHLIDMRLAQPKNLLLGLNLSSKAGMAHLTFSFTVDQLKQLNGVESVIINSPNSTGRHQHSGPMNTAKITTKDDTLDIEFSTPKYSWVAGDTGITLTTDFLTKKNK